MSEKITNTYTFYGNENIKALELEMIKRFQHDRVQGNDEMTSVKRILFGLSQDDGFNDYEKTGSDLAYYFESADGFELESRQSALKALQDHITLCASTVDPDVIVKMNYVGNTPTVIGTRITCIDHSGKVLSITCDQELDCIFCDEDDVIELTNQLESDGYKNPNVMSYQDLKQFIEDLEEFAITDFNAISKKKTISIEKISA